MKKAVFGIVIFTLLFAISCKKSSPVNSWTFKGTTFNTYSVTDSNSSVSGNGVLTALSPQGTLVVNFDGTLPTFNGTYFAAYTGALNSYDQVSFLLTTVGNVTYYSTGGNGSNEQVSVLISSTGKITMTATGVEMINSANPGDSAAMNINITQSQ